MIAAAAVKINKMADGGFPRCEGYFIRFVCVRIAVAVGEFLLIFLNNDCIIK